MTANVWIGPISTAIDKPCPQSGTPVTSDPLGVAMRLYGQKTGPLDYGDAPGGIVPYRLPQSPRVPSEFDRDQKTGAR